MNDLNKLGNLIRHLDKVGDDVIVVSALFPPEKVLSFADERGTVWVLGKQAWSRIEAECRDQRDGVWRGLFGIPIVFLDEGPNIHVRNRIIRSMAAMAEVGDFLDRITKR